MNPFDLIKALLKASESSGDRWKVSVNGERKGPVTRTHSKLEGGSVHLDFGYVDSGEPQSIAGVIALATAGRPGGDDVFTFNGKDVEHDDLVVSTRVVGFRLILVVEFKFDLDDKAFRIRFDGRVL